MNEDQLRELFKATNTAEPLSEGWPGLLRYGLAVAAAERDACAAVAESFDFDERHEIDPPRTLPRYVAQAIRMRSNCKPKFDVCGVVDLEQLWNRTVDEYNKWHTLSCGEKLDFAQAAAITVEREACASKLNLSRSEVSLMAGELSASEWRTIEAVLKGLQARIRGDAK